jgi:hypothetical protein
MIWGVSHRFDHGFQCVTEFLHSLIITLDPLNISNIFETASEIEMSQKITVVGADLRVDGGS